jgi:sulfur relay (sulfurtransferase) DsrF/TusC family protein
MTITKNTSSFSDLHKNNKRAVFDRILAVNDIHKRWKAKDRLEKRNLDPDNTIIKINTGNPPSSSTDPQYRKNENCKHRE